MRLLLPIAILVVACGGAQSNDRGPTFCRSYEDQYLAGCQQHCEGEIEAGDQEGSKACSAKCLDDLLDDSEFSGSCPEQRKKLGAKGG
jgi:hypothetical protein